MVLRIQLLDCQTSESKGGKQSKNQKQKKNYLYSECIYVYIYIVNGQYTCNIIISRYMYLPLIL